MIWARKLKFVSRVQFINTNFIYLLYINYCAVVFYVVKEAQDTKMNKIDKNFAMSDCLCIYENEWKMRCLYWYT